MFKNPFSFKGRIRRTEYGLSAIILLSINILIQILIELNDEADIIIWTITGLLCVFYLWFGIAQGIKRCHDIDFRGWWQLIPFFGIVMLFSDGDKGVNRFGEDPKGRVKEE